MASMSASHLSLPNDVNDEYLLKNGIFDIMNDLASALVKSKPANHLNFMQQWLTNMAQTHQGGNNNDNLAVEKGTITTAKTHRTDVMSDCISEETRDSNIIGQKPLKLAEFFPSNDIDEGSGPIGWRSAYNCGLRQSNPHVFAERSAGKSCQLHVHVDPEAHFHTKQLVDIVHRLSPNDHMAALVFLESLVDKKHAQVSLGFQTMIDSVAGVTMISGESNVNTRACSHRRSSSSFRSSDTYGAVTGGVSCAAAPLHDLLEDALTASVNTREQIDAECKDSALPTAAAVSDIPLCVSQQSAAGRGASSLLSNYSNLKNPELERSSQLYADTPLKRSAKGHYFGFKAPPPTLIFNEEKENKLSNTNEEALVAEELNFLRERFLTYEPFSGLGETLMEIIIRKMKRYTLSSTDLCVLKDGYMFLCSGAVAVERDGQVIQKLEAGDFLGKKKPEQNNKEEISYEIRAISNAVFLFVQYKDYQYLLENEKEEQHLMFFDFFRSSELMNVLSTVERKHLGDALCVRNIKPGSVIVQKGQSIEWFSFIMSGTAVRTVDNKWKEVVEKIKKKNNNNNNNNNESKSCGNDCFSLIVTKGHFIGGFEIFFKLNALTNIVAVTHLTVAQLHLVYFKSYLSRQTLEKMKIILSNFPVVQELAQLTTEEVRQSVEHFKKYVTDVSVKSLGTKVRHHNNSKMTLLSHCGSRMGETTTTITTTATATAAGGGGGGGKALVNGRNFKMRFEGEIMYAGKNNLYRFPLVALETINTIIIAVLIDGTIVRWNPTAERVTGFRRQGVSGRRVFDLIATETGRRSMREQLSQGRKHAGNWGEYVAAGLSSPRVYRFRQASALYHVTLVLSVVPPCPETSSDVLLILGREADNHAAANYIEDATRWMSNVLQPQLRAFQNQAESLEKKNWNMSMEDGKRLVGHVQACNKLMERYLRLSSLNLESMNATWKPVRLHNLLRQFLRDLLPRVRSDGNYLTIGFEDNVPKCEVFFDVEHVLEVLARVVSSASKGKSNICTKIVLSIAEPTSSSFVRRESSSPSTLSQAGGCVSFANVGSPSPRSLSQGNNSAPSSWGSTPVGKEGVRLCKPLQVVQVIDGTISSFSMRRICITLIDNAKGLRCGKDEQSFENFLTNVTVPSLEDNERSPLGVTKSFIDVQRLEVIKDCERLVAGMGGSFFFKTLQEDPEVNIFTIELPLLPVPWGDDSDKECDNVEPFVNRSFTVIIAERDAKQQSILCQLMWARRHAVIPVTSFREVIDKVGKDGVDILVIDPFYLEASEEEYNSLRDGTLFFNTLQQLTHLVVVLYAKDFNDWRARRLIEFCRVIEVPKPAPVSVLHFAMHEAERIVTCLREYEEQIALLRMAFTEFQPDRYKVKQLLGKGTFGEVFEVEDLLTGGKMAMKQMFLNNGVIADDIVQELVAMTSLKHENIIHYLYCQKESDTQLRLFMELASGGTLREKVRKHKGPLPLEDIKRHLHDLCRGLAYLHSQNYVHCDIKTANSLIDHHGRTKIGDFGTAKRLKLPTDKLYTLVGSPQFMAPEVMNADSSQKLGFNQKADIWSLGCIALELATGVPPFSYLECTGGMGIYMYISKLTDVPDLSPLANNCDSLLYAFIKSCFCVNPDERPTAQELLHDEFMQGVDTNSRNRRLVRQVEMAQKLKMYAAMGQEGEEDDEDEDDDDDEEEYEDGDGDDDDGGNIFNGRDDYVDDDDDVVVESKCDDDFDYDIYSNYNNYGYVKNNSSAFCDNIDSNKCVGSAAGKTTLLEDKDVKDTQQLLSSNEENFFATSSSSSVVE